MSNDKSNIDTCQSRWARFRFAVIGPLLAAPPASGELQSLLAALSKKQWTHPITDKPAYFGLSTIERWFYKAQKKADPIDSLRSKRRKDAGKSRQFPAALKQILQQQYREHTSWSYQLHVDNLRSIIKQSPELGNIPTYSTMRRYMQQQGLNKQRRIRKRFTAGAEMAAARLESREVRSFEMDHVNALWHLDFHHGSCRVLGKDGKWHKPLLLAIMDDRSRLICHAQWYLDETTETLVHGFMQALQKRALPRSLMSDNGSAMVADEFTQGLERLSILHEPTLPYSPYQNAKQEVFWGQVEGRLLAMLEGNKVLTLSVLNLATIAWVEYEYHRKNHSELGCAPYERYIQGPDVGRPCPDTQTLRHAFCTQAHRKQRKSDGTISLDGKRFEIPSQYRHLAELYVRYARWDLSYVVLVDRHSNTQLSVLYPQDKSANASGMRRVLPKQINTATKPIPTSSGTAPLLKELMAEYAATGLPPAYSPKGDCE